MVLPYKQLRDKAKTTKTILLPFFFSFFKWKLFFGSQHFFVNIHKLLQNVLFSSPCVLIVAVSFFIFIFPGTKVIIMLWYSRTPKKTSPQAYIYIQPQVSPFLHSHKSRSRKKWRWKPPDPHLPHHRVAVPMLSSARPAGLLTGSTRKRGYPCRKARAWAVPAFGSKPNFPFFCLRHMWLRKDFFLLFFFFQGAGKHSARGSCFT